MEPDQWVWDPEPDELPDIAPAIALPVMRIPARVAAVASTALEEALSEEAEAIDIGIMLRVCRFGAEALHSRPPLLQHPITRRKP